MINFQKTVFLRFFQFFAKTTIFYQKLFEGVIFDYHYNLWLKHSKEWSGTSVRLKFWTTTWKVEKMDKCVAFPVVSPTFCSMSKYVWNELEHSVLQIPSLCVALQNFDRESQSNGQLCLEHVWNEFDNSKEKTGRRSC